MPLYHATRIIAPFWIGARDSAALPSARPSACATRPGGDHHLRFCAPSLPSLPSHHHVSFCVPCRVSRRAQPLPPVLGLISEHDGRLRCRPRWLVGRARDGDAVRRLRWVSLRCPPETEMRRRAGRAIAGLSRVARASKRGSIVVQIQLQAFRAQQHRMRRAAFAHPSHLSPGRLL